MFSKSKIVETLISVDIKILVFPHFKNVLILGFDTLQELKATLTLPKLAFKPTTILDRPKKSCLSTEWLKDIPNLYKK